MEQVEIKCVETEGIGFAPILRFYFERCRISKIIDEHIWCDPKRKKLTHGQACIAMITGIFCQVMQLYHIRKLAKDTTILNVLLPGIESKEYFDDRLADTLDALVSYGLGNLEMIITKGMIEEFNIENDVIHNDTTSASVYGEYGQCDNESIQITYGFSKKHRQDLKQLVWSLSVSKDHAFPLFQQAYSGNTADVDTYVEQWHNLIDLLDRKDFLFVADSKLITKENMVHIHDKKGFFLAPAPMYETYKDAFNDALDRHSQEILIPYKNRLSRGFEVPLPISHNDDDIYKFRMIIIYDHGLFARKKHTINNNIEKTKTAFEELKEKLNKYSLKTKEGIDKACCNILEKYHTTELFEYEITNNPKITYKNKKKGRTKKGKNPQKVKVVTDCYSVILAFKDNIYQDQLYKCGYYPLITNMPKETFTIEDAMLDHKGQYKSEHTNRRAKGEYQLEPIYLHKPQRIEAYLFLFKIALQLLVLIERTARKNIAIHDKGLDDFRPNKKDVRNPKSEYLLKEFQYVVYGKILLQNGSSRYFVSELKSLQKEILEILEVPPICFTYDYLFGGLKIPDY